MSSIFAIIFLIIILGILAFYQATRIAWIAVTGVALILISFFSCASVITLGILWLIFISTTVLFTVPAIRHHLLSQPTLNYVRKSLPPLGETEKIALEAGDVWWDGEIFSGKPQWKVLHSYPKPQLSATEQAFLDNQVDMLCKMLDDYEVVRNQALPEEVWDYLKKERFLGLVIDKEYGGLGFSAIAHSAIVSKIASRCVSAAVSTMVPNSLGPAELIKHYGTTEQKNYYLPKLASGEEIPSFALTGVEIGSDASAMPDIGNVCEGEYNGKTVLGIRLSWEKRYITLAPIATVVAVAFKLYDPEHLLGSTKNIGITLALIPTSHPGVEVGKRHSPLGMGFMNGPTYGKDVFIPIDWIIGGAPMAGQGWRMMMESLSIGRGISLPALSTGISKLSYRTTGAYARIRKQFRQSIGHFEGIAAGLAQIGGFTYITEASRLLTATAVDLQVRPAVVSAIAKYHMTEMARKTVNHAMDIHGGRGVQLGPRNYIGIPYQALPISITVEGANILTRNLMIFGQGATRCHPYVRQEIEAAAVEDTQQGLLTFDKLLLGHIGFTFRNLARTFYYGITGAHIGKCSRKKPLLKYYRQLNRMSSALAFATDIALLILGGQLKRREQLSARLGDVLSYLYLASATLKYYVDQGENAEELIYAEWALQYCLHNMQQALDEFFINFPQHWVGCLLRFITFPWGRSYRGPNDKLGQHIANSMLAPSTLRDRLTANCFIGSDPHDLVGRMDNALRLLVAAEPIEKKLHLAIRAKKIAHAKTYTEQLDLALKADILDEQEVKLLREYEIARRDALQVDEFNSDELTG